MTVCRFCQEEFDYTQVNNNIYPEGNTFCLKCCEAWPDGRHRTADIIKFCKMFINEWICDICGSKFDPRCESNGKISKYCLSCRSDPNYTHSAYCKRHPEKLEERKKDKSWRRSERGRYMRRKYQYKRSSDLFDQNRYQMIYVEELSCVVCGETEEKYLQVDHIVPKAIGGADDRGNLQVLCKSCHLCKTKQDWRLIMRR